MSTKGKRSPIPAELRPEQVTAVVDTREQAPLDLQPLATVTGTLATGDYSVVGLETIIALERKSLPDLLCCIGRERERFDREVQRLLAYPVRALIVEASWPDLEQGEWRGEITPAQTLGSVLGWIAAGLPVVMAGDHKRAGRYVSRLLFTAARRRWREARALIRSVERAVASEGIDGDGRGVVDSTSGPDGAGRAERVSFAAHPAARSRGETGKTDVSGGCSGPQRTNRG